MRAMLTIRRLVGVGLLACLSACASIDERECQDPDWYKIGFEDGSAGFSSDRIEDHRKVCAGMGEAPDVEAWRAGREDGLTHFCSAAGGIAEGSRGRIRSSVCPPELKDSFDRGYRLGREIYETNQEMDRLESEIRALEARSAGGLLSTTVKDGNEARIRQLEREYDRLSRELRLLELRADRLARE